MMQWGGSCIWGAAGGSTIEPRAFPWRWARHGRLRLVTNRTKDPNCSYHHILKSLGLEYMVVEW